MKVKSAFLLSWLFWTVVDHRRYTVRSETAITASAPLDEVEEGAILSVHCQVWELQDHQEVTLFRTLNGKRERVSLKGVLTIEEDRVFLAERQLNDGSIVYFLSVMEVSRSDQGTYMCQVFDPIAQKTVDEDSVAIAILFFPKEHPVCSHMQPLRVLEGDEMVFNCTSERANPTVLLQWSRTATPSSDLKAKDFISTNQVTSILQLRPRLSDSGAVYICKVSSPVFPDEGPTCHIGPIRVFPNPLGKPSFPPEVTPAMDTITEQTKRQPDECAEVCSTSTFNSPVFKWIITTTIAGIVALTFFIVVIIFLWKYYHVQTTTRNLYVTARPQLAEQLYSELECKRSENMTYMSLTKEDTKRLNQEFITKYCPNEQYDDKS